MATFQRKYVLEGGSSNVVTEIGNGDGRPCNLMLSITPPAPTSMKIATGSMEHCLEAILVAENVITAIETRMTGQEDEN